MEHTEYQQIMDRLEGRILCYQNAAARKKAGRKQYTATQMELAKAKAMQEARIIVWMHHEGDSSESQRDAHEKADESPERQASTPCCGSSESKDKERTKFFADMFGDSNIRKESQHLVHALKQQYSKGSRLYVLVLSISGLAQPIAWRSKMSLEEQIERSEQTCLAAGSFGYALFDATKNGQFSLVSTRRRSLHNADAMARRRSDG